MLPGKVRKSFLHRPFLKSLELKIVPGSSVGKESTCSAGDLDLIPGLGRFPGEGNGNPLQYSFLKNSMDRNPGELQSMEFQIVRLN